MKKVTMKDIAEKMGLSINAVSLALNNKSGVSEETRREILRIAEDTGYLENYSKYIATYSSKNICVLLRNIYFRDMHFYSKILLGISEQARNKGYDILVNFFEKDMFIPGCVENKKVSGIIVVGKIEDEYLLKLKGYNIPIVLVDHTSLLESTDSILTDNKLGTFKMTKYLISKGYTKIGFFGDLDYTLSVKERFWGYKEALKTFLIYNDDIDKYINKYSILSDIETFILNSNIEKLIEKIKKINIMPQVFMCSNDSAAIQLNNTLKILNYSIPDDIGIAGFDDIDLCNMITPKLTTIKVNKELMGKKAIDKLLWRLSHIKEPVENIIMNVEIVERQSIK